MTKRSADENEQMPSGRMTATAAYSARIQEAMRYGKLYSQDYAFAMSIMRAVSQGFTEEKWQTEQKSTVSTLLNQPPDKGIAHADAANRYEQTVAWLEDLVLWPW